MKSIKSIRIFELLTRREKLFLLTSYVLLVAILAAPIIYFELFEVHYQFSAGQEHRQLSGFLVVSAIATVLLSIYLIFITIHLGKRLLLTDKEKQQLKRSIEQTRHLVVMGKVLGGVSHSVNNHLLPVIALTEEAIEALDSQPEVAKDLQVVLDAAKGAAHIIKQLKNFSRQEMVLRETCDLGTALERAMTLCENLIPKSVQIHKDIEPLQVRVALSEVSLEIVLLNLVSNAVDAIGREQGSIVISLMLSDIPPEASEALRAYSAWVSLRVEDSGMGMSQEQIDKVFDPFYTTKPEGQGTGLGLSESYGIIKAAGGYINVESTPGIGSAFTIYLPVVLNDDRQGNSRFTPL